MRLVAAPPALGKGALAVEIKFDIPPEKPVPAKGGKGAAKAPPAPPAAKGERVTFTLHVLLMPDGKNTWLAFGANKDDLLKHLAVARSTAPESDTIATRPGLELLRDSKNISGGFTTLSSFAKTAMLSLGGPGAVADQAQAASVLGRMPHQGETPIFMTSTIPAANTPMREVTLRLDKARSKISARSSSVGLL